jgi:hypothetical protein
MKLAFQRRFLDDNGLPLNAGRITLYAHDSQTPITVYSLTGDDYSPAENPMLTTNDGRIDTVFYDDGIIDVKVEKNNGDGTFELLDTFEDGLDVGKNGTSDTQVSTIEELRNVNPEVGTVTVTGYYKQGDCPVRMYMWDPNSTNAIDGGYVIGSDVSDTGRWILMWHDEIIPCTVYGVMPGQYEENITAFLNFPNTVSTKAIATARICRFIPGTYLTDQTYYTSKTLYFDEGAQFVTGEFVCNTAIVPSNTGYVADFRFNGVQKEVHSSWFRTVFAFLTCNAQRYVIDSTNYFTNTSLTGQVTLTNVEIEFHGRLPVTYSGNARINFSRCDLQGSGFFNQTDVVSFSYTEIHDKWWLSPSDIDWVNKVHARTVSLDRLLLQNFQNTTAYVNAIKADGQTKCDLAGRYIASLSANGFTDVLNVDCNSFTYNQQGGGIEIKNVKANSVYVSCASWTIKDSELNSVFASVSNYFICYDSRISFQSAPTFSSLWLTDCDIDGGSTWTSKGQVICEGGYFNASLNYVTDNTTNHSLVKFTNVRFGENNSFTLKNLAIYDSTLTNNTIKMYPYKEGDNYYFSIDLENNIIRNTNPIEFTRIEEIDGWWQEDVYDIILRWTIVNNVFLGNEEGLRMRYWQKRGGQHYNRTFVKMAQGVHSITYEGNVGKCPSDNMRGTTVADNKNYTTESYNDSTIYKYSGSYKRCMMNPVSSIWWNIGPIGGPNTMMKYYSWVNSPYNSVTYSMFVQTTWFSYPRAHDEAVNDGDFFLLAICTFGDYIRIVQQGDGDRNQGVVAKVI